jgi:hypothetical protein
VAGGGGANSLLWFRLEMGDDGRKHYRKKKQTQRARLDSMGRKHDTTQWSRPVERGVTEEGERDEMTPVGLT